MCDTLAELRAGMRRWAAGFDASVLSADDAERVVREAALVEAVAALVKALAAARVAQGEGRKGNGARSAAHHLARVTGSSVGQAADTIATGRRLASLPEVSAAARLVRSAQEGSLGELRRECARTKAAADPDPEARRAAVHRGRYLRSYTDEEGAWNLRVRDNPEVGAQVMAALAPLRDRLFRQAYQQGRREPLEAYAADALAELARGHGGSAKRGGTKLIVRVDLPALLRGRPTEGEVCEIAGFGPVAVSAVRELVDTADPFLAAVVTDGDKVTGVAHLGRRSTAKQRTALEWLSPECSALGCPNVSFLEFDHRIDWSTSHLTVLDLLDRLCKADHKRKTEQGWALVPGHGKRPFVPPDDPRHPRHCHGPPEESGERLRHPGQTLAGRSLEKFSKNTKRTTRKTGVAAR